MLSPAKLVRKESRQEVGALQLRTTALPLADAGNIDNVGNMNKVSATDFNSPLTKDINMQEHMLRRISIVTNYLS